MSLLLKDVSIVDNLCNVVCNILFLKVRQVWQESQEYTESLMKATEEVSRFGCQQITQSDVFRFVCVKV